MMNMQYLNSRWVLGWALVKHVLLRPFVRRDPGVWVARIQQDRLGPTPATAWAAMEASSRCLGCGLCDAVVPAGLPVSQWIQGSIRQPEDAPLALHAAEVLRAAAPAIAAVCPARVDTAAIADLIEAHAAALHSTPLAAAAAPAALPPPRPGP